ncbi:hypothetical protein HYE60_06365 [Aggregatibacter actinomycetemcomitans]|uniref:hypothetical protein n=1 Tax=Aggregatibacter actinomycetemcomitans TaxID=714 RepID=UPI00197C9E95|nr:hypothetical protein [Aggregatibacter actinomycetemcomitans]MBN6074871.1 hypothetical protein [Aggregatibacter actinomycetemcomitans]
MFEKIKPYLIFAKDIIIDTAAFWATFGLIQIYIRFVLTSEINADFQIGILCTLLFVIGVIYKKTISHTQNLHVKGHLSYLCGACILGFALGGFSQAELQQFGFNFSEVSQQAIKQYAMLKSLFYAIGIIALPPLLKLNQQKG